LEPEEYSIIKDKYTHKFDKEKNREYKPECCVICYENFDKGNQLLIDYPDCDHTYHFDCIAEWFRRNMNCPMCKKTIRASILRSIVNGKKNNNKSLSKNKDNREITETVYCS